MKAGGGIALMAVGAILAFAVRDNINAVDLTMVGYILLAVGALATVLAVTMSNQKRSHASQTVATDSAGRQSVTEVRSETSPPAPPAI